MDPNPSCPICVCNDWDVIGERLYTKNDVAHLNTYAKIRYEVLFEIWFPTADEVIVYSILCEHCGFVAYRPRPTEADIQGKYRYLTSHEIARNEYSAAQKVDTRRSKELFKFVRRYLDSAGRAKILDFGGGNGRLMRSFLRAGFACGVVDFVEETILGVDFAGHSLADIPRGDKFDVIICSHVLEHLADPLNTVKALAGFLEPTGILYVEVPSEIWRIPPLAVEPVTHINFFTVASLRCLLVFAGLGVQVCKHDSYLAGTGRHLAVKAIARRGLTARSPRPRLAGNADAARRLIKPTFGEQLMRILRHPELYPRIVLKNLPYFWRFSS